MRVSGVLLAAGASTRFGSSKMLAPVPPEGRPMLAHVIDVWRAAGLEEVIVVLGKDAAALRERTEEDLLRMRKSEGGAGARESASVSGGAATAARTPGAGTQWPAPLRWIGNADWQSGMFSSVRAGLASMLGGDSTHAAISPADLPFLGESSLRRILQALEPPETRGARTLVVPVCGRRRGHPLVIPRELAARVLRWPADARLDRLFAEPDVEVLHLEGFDETILADVDRPLDLVAARPTGAA